MRRPNGEWTTELGRQNGYAERPALPANAQKAITLQMYARDGQLRGRYSLDDGATWTEIGDGFATRRARRTPSIGVAAYNGTGTRGRHVRGLHRRRAAGPAAHAAVRARRTRRRRATRCCSTAPTQSLDELEVLRRRALRARRLHDQVRRRVRPAVHEAGLRGAVLAQARVDDARGRQLRRLRRLPRHRGEHGRHLDLAGRGDPDRPDGQPGPDHGRDLPRAGGGRRRPRRGPQAARVSGTRTRSSCARTASSSS